MPQDAHALPQRDLPQVYAYPERTLRFVAWAWYVAGIVLVLLVYHLGGLAAFKMKQGLAIAGFGLFCVLVGLMFEVIYLNQPGKIEVTSEGLFCTLSWGRRRYLKWDDIREVKRGPSLDPKLYSAWGVVGITQKDRIIITSGLKGYIDLLRTIKAHAIHCKHFDPIES